MMQDLEDLPQGYSIRRLPTEVKRRIVEHLACFNTHAEVVELIAEEFDIALTPRHIRAYDPAALQFASSHRWLDYYRLVRERCLQELGEIAISHRAYRMRHLQSLLEHAIDRGDQRQALKTLKQAAMEMGGCFVKS
jgi:hypothetical protein